jgi:vacuolar-type H+-ATPase subunit I/STV1
MKEAEASLTKLHDCREVLKVADIMINQNQGRIGINLNNNDMENNQGSINENVNEDANLIENSSKSINISNIAGVVEQTEIERLRRLIFRSTKGKSYLQTHQYNSELNDHVRNRKSVYIIVYQDGAQMREKIEKICDSFSGQRFQLPANELIGTEIRKVEASILLAEDVYKQTKRSLKQQLDTFDKIPGDPSSDDTKQQCSTIYIYKMFLAKEKALYQTLNMMKW